MTNDTQVIPDIEDAPFEHDFTQSLILLILPFFLVPASIILFRLSKWAYRLLFKKATVKDVDPWVELGFKRKKNKIKKSSQMHTFEIIDSPDTTPNRSKRLYKFYKTHLSPSAVRDYLTRTRFGRIWMVFQIFVTVLAIANYVTLTYLAHKEERNQRKLVKTLDLFYAGNYKY